MKNKKGPEFSEAREWAVILEDLRSQFRVFGEGQQDLCRRVERIEEKLEHLDQIESDVSQIKSFLRPLVSQVSDHEKRLSALENTR